jgi:hypothetical protein
LFDAGRSTETIEKIIVRLGMKLFASATDAVMFERIHHNMFLIGVFGKSTRELRECAKAWVLTINPRFGRPDVREMGSALAHFGVAVGDRRAFEFQGLLKDASLALESSRAKCSVRYATQSGVLRLQLGKVRI